MNEVRRITVIGSLNIDLVTRASRLPGPGETLTAESFETGPGGKGANQAVACARLSRTKKNKKQMVDAGPPSSSSRDDGERAAVEVQVKMIGAVGDDAFGETLTAALRDNGVDVSGVQTRSGSATGVANVLVETATGENRILIASNANGTMTPDLFVGLPSSRFPDLVVLQLEIPLETVLQILRSARHLDKVQVVLNPAPALPLPDEAYQAITHLILNEPEAAILSDTAVDRFEDEKHLHHVADIFLDKGVHFVVITLGGRGAFYASRQQQQYPDDGRTQGLVSSQKVPVVDTTAAGDTFVGAYAVRAVRASQETFNVREAVEWANRAAATTVQREGAQSAIPWLDELT